MAKAAQNKKVTLSAILTVSALMLASCGHTVEEKAATGAIAGAVVAGPLGAAVGGAAGAVIGRSERPKS